jgi:amino acid transporter
LWPYEGGVYQWAKNGLGPFYGFWSAWNFGLWALLVASSLGLLTAGSLSYAFGPSWAWIAENRLFLGLLNVGLFAFILLINIPGMGIGRWVAHFGTAVTLLVTIALVALLFFHPTASPAHPHIAPQPPFSLALPTLTLLSLNIFSKLAFNGLTGLEQVAVFAGETRDARRTILRSAWIAAPIIALIYILMTGSMLAYTAADKIDLVAPIPQVLGAGFGSASAAASSGLGSLFGRVAILVLAIATIAQFSVIVAETSRLPLVAAWDHLLPQWFTKLHPRYRTPVRGLIVISTLAVLLGLFASLNAGAQEAFQVLSTTGNFCYAINYLLMFAVPIAAGTRFGAPPGLLLRAACIAGAAVTILSMVFSLVPIVDVKDARLYAVKVVLTALALNGIGVWLYCRAVRKARRGAF